jgi:predicted transposase/invertase (TIGR01784 family)
MLDESKIDGGEIMPTLAQQMKEELKEEFMQTLGSKLKEEGKEKGKEEEKKETAKKMLKKGFETDIIMELTGLKKEEIEKLVSEVH